MQDLVDMLNKRNLREGTKRGLDTELAATLSGSDGSLKDWSVFALQAQPKGLYSSLG